MYYHNKSRVHVWVDACKNVKAHFFKAIGLNGWNSSRSTCYFDPDLWNYTVLLNDDNPK